jgi:predicted  nucleic acid-binding Zn-ribbon protein
MYADHHRHHDLENDCQQAQRRITALQDEVDGLREDLGRAGERIRELEERLDGDIRKLWDHIYNMPGGV